MEKMQMLRTIVNDRLNAAVDEIFGVFERTISQYEEEIHRQQKLLDLVYRPEIKLPKSDSLHLPVRDDVPPQQEVRSPSLEQEEPKHPQMKQEQEDLWTSPEGEQLHHLEEADMKYMFSPVSVKREVDADKPHTSWFNETQADCRQTEPQPSTSTELMEPEGGDNCGRAHSLHPARDTETTTYGQLLPSEYPGMESDHSDPWREMREPQAGLITLNSQKRWTVKEMHPSAGSKQDGSAESSHELKSNHIPAKLCCKVCGKTFLNKISLNRHVVVHTNDCGLCGKHLEPGESFKVHRLTHCMCQFCGKIFPCVTNLKRHIITHTGEKLFSCAVCGKQFGRKEVLRLHMLIHTGERPYSCTICRETFRQKGHLQSHMRIHTGEKPYTCNSCGKSFRHLSTFNRHKPNAGEWGCRYSVPQNVFM